LFKDGIYSVPRFVVEKNLLSLILEEIEDRSYVQIFRRSFGPDLVEKECKNVASYFFRVPPLLSRTRRASPNIARVAAFTFTLRGSSLAIRVRQRHASR
jgi:hypothetical protein